jgi:vacuolar-type H+-ATPase subunit E/Vma4
MTTEEKLQKFEETCLDEAKDRAKRVLADYRQGLETTFSKHQEDAARRAELRVAKETEQIDREARKETAEHEIEARRKISHVQEELKDMLFTELRNRLADFMATEDYLRYLDSCVRHCMEFAGGEPVRIYFDPSDTDKIQRISLQNSADIIVSRYSFGGGMRAVIPSKNILIDHSFDTVVEEIRSKYHIEGGVS